MMVSSAFATAGPEREPWVDRGLIALAVIYFAVVAAGVAGHGLEASAETIGDGRVWLLLTSSLRVSGSWHGAQLAIGVVSAAVVISREGPRLWWLVILLGQIVSALVAYGIIAIAIAFGSGSAKAAAGHHDFGISTVLAATLGALLVSGLTVPRMDSGERRPVDLVAILGGVFGLIGMAAISFGWYHAEHLLAFAVGALVTRWWVAGGRRLPD